MRKTREEKAITLIALIITIVVLLILAVVAINSVTGDGIIQHATNAKTQYEEAQDEEKSMLDSYLGKLEENLTDPIPISEAQGKVLSTVANLIVIDDYENKIKVPAGFMITDDADNVADGIVIQDATKNEDGTPTVTNGSQFVWIPVGNINKEDGTTVNIELNRYKFADGENDKDSKGNVLKQGTPISQGNAVISTYYQELATSIYGNSVAKDVEEFKRSVANNGGYYIGRYEARTTNTNERENDEEAKPATCIGSNSIYNWISQENASTVSKNMYINNLYTSDLINSYAWDTAIVFIQTFEDEDYSYTGSSNTDNYAITGTTDDVKCNIYDMASNLAEFSTETSSYSKRHVTVRGGYFIYGSYKTKTRVHTKYDVDDGTVGFRTIIYL